MPKFGSISRNNLIKNLKFLNFDGPFPGGNHQFMRNEKGVKLIIPNPHKGDIGSDFLHKILKQAGISRKDWEKL
jgi:predicted RNA binding protein YcfA (HicA-like mRNA interferase family)